MAKHECGLARTYCTSCGAEHEAGRVGRCDTCPETPKDKPQTNAEWLRYADYWWEEIEEFCGLDPSFVGAYSDDAAISYARNYHGGA